MKITEKSLRIPIKRFYSGMKRIKKKNNVGGIGYLLYIYNMVYEIQDFFYAITENI